MYHLVVFAQINVNLASLYLCASLYITYMLCIIIQVSEPDHELCGIAESRSAVACWVHVDAVLQTRSQGIQCKLHYTMVM